MIYGKYLAVSPPLVPNLHKFDVLRSHVRLFYNKAQIMFQPHHDSGVSILLAKAHSNAAERLPSYDNISLPYQAVSATDKKALIDSVAANLPMVQ